MKSKTYYQTYGSVRGCCDHHHRTISGAARCFLDDCSGCKKQGGYSDRGLIKFVDNKQVEVSENEYDEFMICVNNE